MSVRIDYLANHLELAPLLAAWHYQEWHALLPDWSLVQATVELQSHTGQRQLPTTLVALENESLLGSASLVVSDLPGWDHYTPWVASVYVIPERRGQGIGKLLMNRAVDEAAALGVPVIYLFTAGQQVYYERLGWSPVQRVRPHEAEVVIMERRTTA